MMSRSQLAAHLFCTESASRRSRLRTPALSPDFPGSADARNVLCAWRLWDDSCENHGAAQQRPVSF